MIDLLEICGDKQYFYQWDKNKKIKVLDEDIDSVHFADPEIDVAIVVQLNKERECSVPDKLLESDGILTAYAERNYSTKYVQRFEILKREKPEI